VDGRARVRRAWRLNDRDILIGTRPFERRKLAVEQFGRHEMAGARGHATAQFIDWHIEQDKANRRRNPIAQPIAIDAAER